VIFHTIPVALSIPMSSRGDCMALSAASLARVLPVNRPTETAGQKGGGEEVGVIVGML
jgi:hypothetical protein